MRTSIWIAAALAAVGCGKQLNPEFCQDHPKDLDCLDAGLVSIDAPPPCRGDLDCAGMTGRTVCDTTYGECVQCTTGDNPCPTNAHVCSRQDTCVGCTMNADCASGVCVTSSGMCADVGKTLWVSPSGGGDCTQMTSPCTLSVALTKVVPGSVIQMLPGSYTGTWNLTPVGPYTIQGGQPIGQTPDVTITSTTGGKPAFIVPSGVTVMIANVTIQNGPADADGIDCMGGTVTLSHVFILGNGRKGISADGCTLQVDHSWIDSSGDTGVFLNDATVTIFDNYISRNGTAMIDHGIGGMRLQGTTTGSVRFNTIAVNNSKNGVLGISCMVAPGALKLYDDLVADIIMMGDGPVGPPPGGPPPVNEVAGCPNEPTLIVTDQPHFAGAMNAPPDLHLTDNTPEGPMSILNNQQPNTSCGAADGVVLDDFEGEQRPQDTFCDVGGDEHHIGG